ncbi:MAG: hypothetical protein ACE5PO_03410 [Candidatus Bathyarchaeia archaeon]
MTTQEGAQAGDTPAHGEPGQQQYQPYPQYAPPPRQPINLGKIITKPLIAIGFLIGLLMVWLSFVIFTFANGDVSVRDFASFLKYSGAAVAGLVAFIGGLTSTNFDGHERVGLLIAAGVIFLALLGI